VSGERHLGRRATTPAQGWRAWQAPALRGARVLGALGVGCKLGLGTSNMNDLVRSRLRWRFLGGTHRQVTSMFMETVWEGRSDALSRGEGEN
jgi:hypothetical protein